MAHNSVYIFILIREPLEGRAMISCNWFVWSSLKEKNNGLQKLSAKEMSLPSLLLPPLLKVTPLSPLDDSHNPQLVLLGFVSASHLILARVSILQFGHVTVLLGALQPPLLWKKNADGSLRLTQGPACPAGTALSRLSPFPVSYLTHLC